MSLCVKDYLAILQSAYTYYDALSTMSSIWFAIVVVATADKSYFGVAETI
jgi:hypothetical protein